MTNVLEASRAEHRHQDSKRAFPQNPEGFGAMSVQTFCTWAGIGLSKAYSEISAGNLKVCKAGRKTLIRVSDAEAWLAALPPPDSRNRYGSPKPRKQSVTK